MRVFILLLTAAILSAGDAVYVTAFRDPCRALEVHRLAKADAARDHLVVDDGKSQRNVPVSVIGLPRTGHVLHRALIDGLAPATEVRLRFGQEPEVRVRTLADNLSRPLRIANGGDTMHKPEWFANTTRVLAAQDPDLVVFGGDLAYENGKDGERVLTWIRTWHEHGRTRDGRVLPFISCIGNHEVDGGNGEDPSKAPYYFAMMPLDGVPYRAVDVGAQVSFVLLDSDHTTRIPGAQTDWLKSVMAERASRAHVIPVYHYPAWPSVKSSKGKSPYEHKSSVLMRDLWLPLFEANGVRVALEHDQHSFKRTVPIRAGKADPTGITYLGDGAWGVEVRKVFPDLPMMAKTDSRRHGWILDLHADGQIEATAIDENGAVFDQVVIPRK
jgi:acid phosphatase type 7